MASSFMRNFLLQNSFGRILSVPQVSESFVCFRHPVGVFALLDAGAGAVERVNQLRGQLVDHRLARSLASVADEPAKGQGAASARSDLHRHLVRLAADASGPDFDGRHDVRHRLLEHFEAARAGLLLGDGQGGVEDLLADRLLAIEHQAIDEALIDEALLSNPSVYPDEEVSERLFDVSDLGEATRLYNDAWTELKTLLGQ